MLSIKKKLRTRYPIFENEKEIIRSNKVTWYIWQSIRHDNKTHIHSYLFEPNPI